VVGPARGSNAHTRVCGSLHGGRASPLARRAGFGTACSPTAPAAATTLPQPALQPSFCSLQGLPAHEPSFRTSSGGVQAAERRAGRRLGGGPGTGRGVVGRGGRGPAPDGGGCLRRAPFSSAGRLTPAGVSSREQPGAGSKGRCLGTRPGSAPRSCRKTISHNSTGQSSAHSAGVPARRGLSRIPRRSARDCPARAERRAGTLT